MCIGQLASHETWFASKNGNTATGNAAANDADAPGCFLLQAGGTETLTLYPCCRRVQPMRGMSGEGMYEGPFHLTASRIAACHSVLHGSGQQHMPMWPSQIPDCQIDVADMLLERLAALRVNSPCRLVRTSCRSGLAVFQHCTSNLMDVSTVAPAAVAAAAAQCSQLQDPAAIANANQRACSLQSRTSPSSQRLVRPACGALSEVQPGELGGDVGICTKKAAGVGRPEWRAQAGISGSPALLLHVPKWVELPLGSRSQPPMGSGAA